MKKLIASILVLCLLVFTVVPAFAALTPTFYGKQLTNNGWMLYGTFTGLGTNGAGSTTLTIPGINVINSLTTGAAASAIRTVSVLSTVGACSIKSIAKNVITVSQEGVTTNTSGGTWFVIGR